MWCQVATIILCVGGNNCCVVKVTTCSIQQLYPWCDSVTSYFIVEINGKPEIEGVWVWPNPNLVTVFICCSRGWQSPTVPAASVLRLTLQIPAPSQSELRTELAPRLSLHSMSHYRRHSPTAHCSLHTQLTISDIFSETQPRLHSSNFTIPSLNNWTSKINKNFHNLHKQPSSSSLLSWVQSVHDNILNYCMFLVLYHHYYYTFQSKIPISICFFPQKIFDI